MLGYVFDQTWAARNSDMVRRFIEVTRKGKEILATSDAEWERIARLVGVSDPAVLKVYRERYREGIPRRSVEDEEADARTVFRLLATEGGANLVGAAAALAPGTFFRFGG
jgi:NitT/TauT family transport system substrate-binding protein